MSIELAVKLLREDVRRTVYEGASSLNTKIGSNSFYLTYCPGGPALSASDVRTLVKSGFLLPDAGTTLFARGPKLPRDEQAERHAERMRWHKEPKP